MGAHREMLGVSEDDRRVCTLSYNLPGVLHCSGVFSAAVAE